MTNWIDHVKMYQKEHNCSYKEALKGASATYTKKTSKKTENPKKKKTPKVITAEPEDESDDSETYL